MKWMPFHVVVAAMLAVAMEMLVKKLGETPSNAAFLERIGAYVK